MFVGWGLGNLSDRYGFWVAPVGFAIYMVVFTLSVFLLF